MFDLHCEEEFLTEEEHSKLIYMRTVADPSLQPMFKHEFDIETLITTKSMKLSRAAKMFKEFQFTEGIEICLKVFFPLNTFVAFGRELRRFRCSLAFV